MELSPEEWEIVRRSKLFSGIAPERLRDVLACLHARRAEYGSEKYVLREGDRVSQIGLVLSGRARSVKEVREGEPLIISLLEPGSFLGILLAASHDRASPVSVQAQEPLAVLFFPAERLTSSGGDPVPDQPLLLRSFLNSVAE